jgi:hypothetical protein
LSSTLDGARRIFRLHVLEQFARHGGVRAEAAADQQMKAIDRVAIVIDRNARADHADVADIVLRAGMMAAGEMDVDGRLSGTRSSHHAAISSALSLV